MYGRVGYEHLGIDDPVKVFLALLTPTVTTPYTPEELRVPVDTLAVSFRGFLALSVFDSGLCIRSDVLVPALHSLRHFVPQPL